MIGPTFVELEIIANKFGIPTKEKIKSGFGCKNCKVRELKTRLTSFGVHYPGGPLDVEGILKDFANTANPRRDEAAVAKSRSRSWDTFRSAHSFNAGQSSSVPEPQIVLHKPIGTLREQAAAKYYAPINERVVEQARRLAAEKSRVNPKDPALGHNVNMVSDGPGADEINRINANNSMRLRTEKASRDGVDLYKDTRASGEFSGMPDGLAFGVNRIPGSSSSFGRSPLRPPNSRRPGVVPRNPNAPPLVRKGVPRIEMTPKARRALGRGNFVGFGDDETGVTIHSPGSTGSTLPTRPPRQTLPTRQTNARQPMRRIPTIQDERDRSHHPITDGGGEHDNDPQESFCSIQ